MSVTAMLRGGRNLCVCARARVCLGGWVGGGGGGEDPHPGGPNMIKKKKKK
jgi:hypothetical protein